MLKCPTTTVSSAYPPPAELERRALSQDPGGPDWLLKNCPVEWVRSGSGHRRGGADGAEPPALLDSGEALRIAPKLGGGLMTGTVLDQPQAGLALNQKFDWSSMVGLF